MQLPSALSLSDEIQLWCIFHQRSVQAHTENVQKLSLYRRSLTKVYPPGKGSGLLLGAKGKVKKKINKK